MSTAFALVGADIFDGHRRHAGQALVIENGSVAGIANADALGSGIERVACDGGLIAPGFVDLQVNGGGGVMLNEVPDPEGIETLCAAHFPFGTTALLPTLITDTPKITRAALDAGIAARKKGIRGFAGLHIEGPHLSLARKGAHSPELIRPMEDADRDALIAARAGLDTLLTTVAVEAVTLDQIGALARAGVIVSLGHSEATIEEAHGAFAAGASMVTHLFNAMSQMGHRAPGLVGAALDAGVWSGLIADGLHVHPAMIGIALRGHRAPGRIFLVTDAMSVIGTDIARLTLNGREVVRKDGALRLPDGTLAGADLTMIDAVRFIHRTLGLDLCEALRMAALYPARAIGRDDRLGHLAPGADASLVLLGEDLDIRGVWVKGERVAGEGR